MSQVQGQHVRQSFT